MMSPIRFFTNPPIHRVSRILVWRIWKGKSDIAKGWVFGISLFNKEFHVTAVRYSNPQNYQKKNSCGQMPSDGKGSGLAWVTLNLNLIWMSLALPHAQPALWQVHGLWCQIYPVIGMGWVNLLVDDFLFILKYKRENHVLNGIGTHDLKNSLCWLLPPLCM